MKRDVRPSAVSDLVARFLGESEGLPKKAREALALKVFAAFEKIGKPVTDRALPVYFRTGVLTLEVNESAWLTELSFLKPELLQRINGALGKEAVKDIRLRLGTRRRPADPPRLGRRLSAAETEAIDQYTEAIADPDVREAVRRAARTSLSMGPSPGRFVPGPPGPRPPPKAPAPEPEPGLTYGYGDRHEDRWKKKAPSEAEEED